MFRFRWILLVFVLCLLLSVLPVAAQESTPEATPPAPVELSETYTDDDDSLSFDYPAGWTLQTNWTGDYSGWRLSVHLIRNPDLPHDLMERFMWQMQPGSVVMDVDIYDIKSFELAVGKSREDITLEDVVRFRLFGLSATPLPPTTPTMTPNSGVTLSKPQTFMLGDQDAMRVDIILGNKDVGAYIFTLENGLEIEVALFTAPDERDQWISTALAIAESITYSS